ncbi:penicillin-binding transpeptidase domain-containing protein [soil metagenome]
MPASPPARRLAAAALAAAVLLGGCTGSGDEPGAGADSADSTAAAADQLAAALTEGSLDTVRVTDRSGERSQRWWDRVVAGMGDQPPAVQVSEVSEGTGGTTAEASLDYRWDLPGRDDQTWTYQTTANLRRDDAGWSVLIEPSLVAPGLRSGEVLRAVTVQPPRAEILGAGNTALVTGRPVQRLGIDKANVAGRRAPRSARQLARLVDIDVDVDSFADRVSEAGGEAFVEAIVLRADDVTPRIRRGVGSIPGALAIDADIPLAPTRGFAAPILGTVGEATAELIERSDGGLDVGDQVGLSGLQQRYDDTLRGAAGVRVEAVDDAGRARRLHRVPPVRGQPLRTTLDLQHQLLAEELLSDIGPASALVAVRPSDGHLLAAASGPGSQGYSTATVGQYAPGSTFKVVTSLALLRAGATPKTTVSCTQTTTVDGKSFKNYDDYPADRLGDITLRTAVANSCNTALVTAAQQLPQRSLVQAAAALGVGVDHDLGFPAYFGSVPDTATATEHAAAAIGQGKVIASPMVMAAAAASVARGRTVVPRLLPAEDELGDSEPAADEPLTAREAAQLRDLMGAVVDDGSAGFLAELPGRVLAKTGTAEYGTTDPLRTHAWMIAARGDLAVAVFVETGESGGRTAGPIISAFLERAV